MVKRGTNSNSQSQAVFIVVGLVRDNLLVGGWLFDHLLVFDCAFETPTTNANL
eukprot:m.28575 g.28575  ORF g.28575 m.28575 type:complete len:53 (+) comp9486_c0_seq1:78-236(+)